MKRALVSVKKWNGHPRYSYVCHFRQGGKRQTRYFVHKKDATSFAGEKEVELLNEGRKHGELSEEESRPQPSGIPARAACRSGRELSEEERRAVIEA